MRRSIFSGSILIRTALSFLVPFVFSSAAHATFLPPNKLHLHPTPLEKSNITQRQFNDIIAGIEKVYSPVISGHKAKLKVNRLWNDETVNASASQDGKTWELNMYGGLARRPEVTPDGFALVVCHELGHHLGGFAFWNGDIDWAANEGQSDYFAVQSCAKEIWKSDVKENAKHRATVNPVAKTICETNYSVQEERDLCFRTANAGLSLASLLAALNETPPPRFETPNTTVVDATQDAHPEAQCRLDTYLAGAVCSVAFNKTIIPAKDLGDHYGVEAETAAAKYSCMASDGWVTAQRPRCWFKPQQEFEGLIVGDAVWSDSSGNGQAQPGEVLKLAVALGNHWSKSNEAIIGEIFSRTNGISVLKGKTTYPDLAPGATVHASEAFEIRVSSDFQCGHPFEILFRAGSKYGSRETAITWFVGPKQSKPVVIGGSSDATVIDDYPSEGVAIPMRVNSAAVAEELELELQLVGLYPEEVEFTLVTPAGKSVPVQTGAVFDESGNATVKIPLGEATPLRGKWILRARDLQENDLSTIAHFELRAPLAEKVTCEKIK